MNGIFVFAFPDGSVERLLVNPQMLKSAKSGIGSEIYTHTDILEVTYMAKKKAKKATKKK